eukprot:2929796-Amphidinium_carterae.1
MQELFGSGATPQDAFSALDTQGQSLDRAGPCAWRLTTSQGIQSTLAPQMLVTLTMIAKRRRLQMERSEERSREKLRLLQRALEEAVELKQAQSDDELLQVYTDSPQPSISITCPSMSTFTMSNCMAVCGALTTPMLEVTLQQHDKAVERLNAIILERREREKGLRQLRCEVKEPGASIPPAPSHQQVHSPNKPGHP